MSCCMDDICFHKLLQHLKLFHQKMYCGELRTDWEILQNFLKTEFMVLCSVKAGSKLKALLVYRAFQSWGSPSSRLAFEVKPREIRVLFVKYHGALVVSLLEPELRTVEQSGIVSITEILEFPDMSLRYIIINSLT